MMDHQNYHSLSQEVNEINESEEIETNCKEGDAQLIDLVKNYSHLYDKSSKDFKDVNMKANSWREILEIMHWSSNECQIRWVRLRDRYSKERRNIELDSRSGNGAPTRSVFQLYENMKFLEKHVRRRRCYNNMSQIKNKENILNNILLHASGRQSMTSSTPSSNLSFSSIKSSFIPISNSLDSIPLHESEREPMTSLSLSENLTFSSVKSSFVPTNIFCQSSESSKAQNIYEENNVMQTELSSSSTSYKPERCSSTISSSDSATPISPFASQYDKCFTPKKTTGKKETQTKEIDKNIEDKFGELIAAELKKMSEPTRIEKKKRL